MALQPGRILRFLALAALALALPRAAAANDIPSTAPTTMQERYYAPMRFMLGRLATTKPCGLDCVDFVVAEGFISFASSFRFMLATRPLGARRPPVLLDSPGGLRGGMSLLAEIWKTAGVTIVIARAREVPCGGSGQPACDPADAKARVKVFEVSAEYGACESACPFAILGAPARVVPDGARIGVHSPSINENNAFMKRIREINPEFKTENVYDALSDLTAFAERYGAPLELAKRAAATPGSEMYYLTPDEIAAFRIATMPLSAAGLPAPLVAALAGKRPGAR